MSWNKTGQKKKDESKSVYLNNQHRKNNTVSVDKIVSNKSQINVVSNIKQIEKEEDTFKHKTVSLSISKRIAAARCNKKMSQKDLANTIYLPYKIIQDYESGKAIPNPLVLNKIEKALGVRVRD